MLTAPLEAGTKLWGFQRGRASPLVKGGVKSPPSKWFRLIAVVTTAVEFLRDDGGAVRVRGEFAAFTDPTATDLSVLGRDVLDNFG